MRIGTYKGYPIHTSNHQNKKYKAFVNGHWVHFGDRRYEQYYDIFGHYKHLDHHDQERRRLYYARHGKSANEGTSKWFSHHILWPLEVN